jgi:peptidoglycan/xylan/chitin deacetylase (PgdA/CDA1 family)
MSKKSSVFHRFKSFAGQKLMGTITNISTDKKVASLTFDDGPSPEYTPKILEVLRRYNAKATFFALGASAQKYPELLDNIHNEGHAIGNHTFDHTSFPMYSSRQRRKQLTDCQKIISKYQNVKLFRPPYGHQNISSRFDLLLLGYKVITWDVIAEDWLEHSAEQMADTVINKMKPGSIILFHDALNNVFEQRLADRQPTIKAVEMILDRLKDEFKFVTVPELLKTGKPVKRNWNVPSDKDLLEKLQVAI